MPAELPAGLAIGAVLPREIRPTRWCSLPVGANRAQLRSGPISTIRESLGPGARIGTGSVRRIAQLRRLFPDVNLETIRGNWTTASQDRLKDSRFRLCWQRQDCGGLGLRRRISLRVPLDDCIPAPGQGIIAIETRADDSAVRAAVAAVNDAEAATALDAERALVTALGGGCQMPVGGLAMSCGPASIELHAVVASLDGARAVRYKQVERNADAAALGRESRTTSLKSGAKTPWRTRAKPESGIPDPWVPSFISSAPAPAIPA